MNKNNVSKLIAVLRSGELPQGFGRLGQVVDGQVKHCFWGAACEVYRREVGGAWRDPNDDGKLFFDAGGGGGWGGLFEPEAVRDWYEIDDDKARHLMWLNDSCHLGFDEIAKHIEMMLEDK